MDKDRKALETLDLGFSEFEDRLEMATGASGDVYRCNIGGAPEPHKPGGPSTPGDDPGNGGSGPIS